MYLIDEYLFIIHFVQSVGLTKNQFDLDFSNLQPTGGSEKFFKHHVLPPLQVQCDKASMIRFN